MVQGVAPRRILKDLRYGDHYVQRESMFFFQQSVSLTGCVRIFMIVHGTFGVLASPSQSIDKTCFDL